MNKLILLAIIAILPSCTPTEAFQNAAIEAGFIYLNHEINSK